MNIARRPVVRKEAFSYGSTLRDCDVYIFITLHRWIMSLTLFLAFCSVSDRRQIVRIHVTISCGSSNPPGRVFHEGHAAPVCNRAGKIHDVNHLIELARLLLSP